VNNPGVTFQDVLCDEKLVTAAGRGWHGVLIFAALRLQETHLLMIRWCEDLFFLSISGELSREYLLLNIGVWSDFRNL
jgi:hypothetical protein